MRMYDIIAKKRDHMELSAEEIAYWIQGYTKGEIPDYQSSALLMSIFLNGMNQQETADLTMAMAASGEQLDLSDIRGIKVDKHSTGGVGDKTTLILGPLVASAGVSVAKMSGRGLGHTGGTIDKVESIPGFNTQLKKEEFIYNVNNIGIALAGQTGNLVPADKKLYALRDVTATVNNLSLIASSIMSKKIASGSDAIVLDVKTGSGAFMKDTEEAFQLAQEMIRIGIGVGREVVAVITDMDQPLGYAVGNSVEVIESIETLKGNGPQDLIELCLILGSYMLLMGKVVDNIEEGESILRKKLSSGKALKKFEEWIAHQGGNIGVINDYHLFPKSEYIRPVIAKDTGTVASIDSERVGIASLLSGAGRITKESQIDLGAGIILQKKIGNKVKSGEAIAEIYTNDASKINEIEETVLSAYKISQQPVQPRKLIHGIVSKEGTKRF
ncbi:pyrimidine-nucleoside phosphorylase [Petroclostridium sp. X23]|uniref:pyrimidine-nucleoside phosphorylase n=1 Tax=Petroclostridium sp. X23 TaxID=3045146 RepID=UPI0024AC93BC|nr:pyrimidine-nucleoside phosphorylase [Petroclostridium sp. X23]WHH59437.1 pyrimidine-nucleoside phosphorylase [Petroclostridium sp. X23]